MFKVIIAGGRDFYDHELLGRTMDNLLSNITDEIQVVCGMARGADSVGDVYAAEKDYSVKYFPAEWDKYGKSAGYRRNEQMAEYADALVAFWDGKSKGTKHMIETARKHGLKVRVVPYVFEPIQREPSLFEREVLFDE